MTAASTSASTSASTRRLSRLLARRSVSPKRLVAPGLNADQLARVAEAAATGPDHGRLRPWRVIDFPQATRAQLADAFEREKLRRDPLASASDLRRAREHAERAPTLLAFVVSPDPRSRVPVREQWLAAGAALGNLVNAAHLLGFGAIVLSGERCWDEALMSELGLRESEALAGFVCVGTASEAPAPRDAAPATPRVSIWPGPDATLRAQAARRELLALGRLPTARPAGPLFGKRVLHVGGWGESSLICGFVTRGGGIYQRHDGSVAADRRSPEAAIAQADVVAYSPDSLAKEPLALLRSLCERHGIGAFAVEPASLASFLDAWAAHDEA